MNQPILHVQVPSDVNNLFQQTVLWWWGHTPVERVNKWRSLDWNSKQFIMAECLLNRLDPFTGEKHE